MQKHYADSSEKKDSKGTGGVHMIFNTALTLEDTAWMNFNYADVRMCNSARVTIWLTTARHA